MNGGNGLNGLLVKLTVRSQDQGFVRVKTSLVLDLPWRIKVVQETNAQKVDLDKNWQKILLYL